ncbi:MAG TPA: hypothetical protein VM470_08395 [Acidimicrobiia bacterium]|nr:hypothetical protein [Acidimicrobiia bacterium]
MIDAGLPTSHPLPTLALMKGRRSLIASFFVIASALVWAATLAADPGIWDPGAALIMGAGLIVAGSVAIAAILVQSSPLGYRLGWGLLAFEALIALLRPLSPAWAVGVALIAGAGVAMVDSTLGGTIRQLPPPSPIPGHAIALCLSLLIAGPVAAVGSAGSPVGRLGVFTGLSWLLLLWYVRLWPGREWAVRLMAPVLLLLGLTLPAPGSFIWIALLTTATALAWTPGARLAVRPLVERGYPVPIPPELAPPEVLRAAGVDERGRRQRPGSGDQA